MKITIFVGTPYNQWMSIDDASKIMSSKYLFENFRLEKEGFYFQLITERNKEIRISFKFQNMVEIIL